MNERDRGAWGSEIFFQCQIAVKEIGQAFVLHSTKPPEDPQAVYGHVIDIFGCYQAFLTATGVLSDTFFPNPNQGGDQDRARELCHEYSVGPGSPFDQKKVRNFFLHSDERLDRFLKAHPDPTKVIGAFTVGVLDREPQPVAQAKRLRVVDLKNLRILVFGDQLELRPLLTEIQRIQPLAAKYLGPLHTGLINAPREDGRPSDGVA
jgi:hypothetical protein